MNAQNFYERTTVDSRVFAQWDQKKLIKVIIVMSLHILAIRKLRPIEVLEASDVVI